MEKKENKNKLSDETISLIKIILIVAASFGLLYGLFILLGRVGMFEPGYTKPEAPETEFTYNTAIIGTVFNRPEMEYYVSFDKEEDGDAYYKSMLNTYKGDLTIYKVNMSLGINADYIGKEGNKSATNSNELTIVCPTLIKIKNGKIIKYIENIEEIENELSN